MRSRNWWSWSRCCTAAVVTAAWSVGTALAGPVGANSSTPAGPAATPAGGEGAPTSMAVPPPRWEADIPFGKIIAAEPVAGMSSGFGGGIASAAAPGDPCTCDADCQPAADQCQVARCRRTTVGPNLAGTCEEVNAPLDARCDLDGLFCTDDRCDATGTCVAVAPRCAKECVGGTNAGQNCLRDSDCSGGTCQLQANVTCNETDDRCELTDGVGRCCQADDTCTYVTLAACNGVSGKWLRLNDPDDVNETCVCPKYGSGIAPEGTWVTDLGPVRQSPNVCNVGTDLCDDISFCQRRCVGGVDDGEICLVDIDCDSANCVQDTCVPASPARCSDGFLRIGDDYATSNNSAMRLQRFRFRGGVEKPDEVLVFEFYDNASPPVFARAFAIRFLEPGIRDYTIQLDCFPDCDATELETPRDPPFIIPGAGHVVMRSTRTEWSVAPLDPANGHWMTTDAVDAGTNNANSMWVDGNSAVNHLGNGNNILSFELVGEKVNVLGGCCDPGTGVCTDSFQWECRSCSGTGNPCQQFPDCGFNDFCIDVNWFGPKSHNDFVLGAGQLCADEPCAGGACCAGDGSCTFEDGPGNCAGEFLGFGVTCAPNCCDQPATGGDCCEDTAYCSDPSDTTTCNLGNIGANCGTGGTCTLCTGAQTIAIVVPDPLDPAVVVPFSGDSSGAVFTQALGDDCSIAFNDTGWYEQFSIDDDAKVTLDFCCNSPLKSPVWIVINENCPCESARISPDNNVDGIQGGFGVACNNDHCCADGNFSAQFTLPAGTYSWQIYGNPTCTGTVDTCVTNADCLLGATCDTNLGPYKGHITVEGAPPAACCLGDVCDVLNVLKCESLLCRGGSNDLGECDDDTDCPGGICKAGRWLGDADPQPIADCFADPCDTGVCCLGPGNCNTVLNTRVLCEGQDGVYVGGTGCTQFDPPCPVCTFRTNANCKFDTGAFIVPSDRSLAPPLRRADDFRPAGSTISSVCWWPAYFNPFTGGECVQNPPPDDFRVRFFEDDNGLPGIEVGPSGGQTMVPAAKVWRGGNSRVWEYTATLSTPVSVTPGSCYWVEITGFGEGEGCTIYLLESLEGNGYGMADADGVYGPEDVSFFLRTPLVDVADFAYCISTGMASDDDCGPVTAPCCVCGVGCSLMTHTACHTAGGYFYPGEQDCSTVTCSVQPANDNCSGKFQICTGQSNCQVPLDNRCATTDGNVGTCFPITGTGPGNEFIQDLWFEYIPPCNGTMTIDTCSDDTKYDTMIALYAGTSGTCACPSNDNNLITVPRIPPPGTIPLCDDNNGRAEHGDTFCDDIAPDPYGKSRIEFGVAAGTCYLVRVGGDRGSIVLRHGDATLSIDVACQAINSAAVAPFPHNRDKNRYVSFAPNNTGGVAFKVFKGANHIGWVGNPDANGISKVETVQPALRVWTEQVIHVGDCEIHPVQPYGIVATDGSVDAPALIVNTIPLPSGGKFWGDTVGGFDGSSWGPPNNIVNANDFLAALQKFQNLPQAPHVSVVDVQSVSSIDPCLNKLVNIADVFLLLQAFQGNTYPFTTTAASCPACP